MIQLSAVGKHFGSKTLFEGLNWVVGNNERVGLVGANGTGKSTLLKMLAGIEGPDDGDVSFVKGTTTGYLPQDGLTLSGGSVTEECLSVFGHLLDIEKEMEQLTHKMGEIDPKGPEYQKVADRYHKIETKFQQHDGYRLEAQVGEVLNGLGFSRADQDRRTEEFSGGWQMRIALAKLLLTKPNMLLLDEPTNHLDLEARNWLEQYLHDYPYSFVVISHDRYFLDVTVDRILEIWNKKTFFYTGNYDRYLLQKNDRRVQLEAAYRNQRDRIEQVEAFINRFRYQATKAKQVQSRIKELERIERIELPDEEKIIHFSFPQPKPSGKIVAECKDVAKSYGEKRVFSGINFTISRGDRISLVGINGAGKSTLIKLLSGVEKPTAGEFRLGHNVEADYFAQDQYKALDPNATLIDDIASVAPIGSSGQTQLRSILGSFLFSADEVFKKIGVLSGGERNRYALARMLLHPANFLLLDEPTNHLDMQAKDVLLEALQKFTGTVLFVSHDRYFIDKLANRVFEIENGHFEDFQGNYEDYLWQKDRRGKLSTPLPGVVSAPLPGVVSAPLPGAGQPSSAASGNGASAKPAKKVNPVLIRKMEQQREQLEAKIAECEKEITAYELDLANFKSAEESKRVAALLEDRRTRLAAITRDWEELALALEGTRAP